MSIRFRRQPQVQAAARRVPPRRELKSPSEYAGFGSSEKDRSAERRGAERSAEDSSLPGFLAVGAARHLMTPGRLGGRRSSPLLEPDRDGRD
jgi:hypothetical protein